MLYRYPEKISNTASVVTWVTLREAPNYYYLLATHGLLPITGCIIRNLDLTLPTIPMHVVAMTSDLRPRNRSPHSIVRPETLEPGRTFPPEVESGWMAEVENCTGTPSTSIRGKLICCWMNQLRLLWRSEPLVLGISTWKFLMCCSALSQAWPLVSSCTP